MIKKLLTAALFALAAIPAALGAQASYSTPTTGPMSFGTFVSSYLNPVLAAIQSQNSGSTAPASPIAYEVWVDTSTTPKTVKVYDGSSWLALATIDTSGHLLALNGSTLKLLGSTSGNTVLQPSAAASGTLTLPAATDTLVGKATTDTLTNKTFDTAATGNSLSINGLAATANTGTGAVVRATSPTLVTPALGTPSSGTLTNATGLPIGTGVSGLGTGVATALATPSSANLAAAVTDETGTGALVFGTAPTITLGNGTGLPIATGVSGLGTGISTWLGTPSSANLASAITDETGTGAAVFATSPTLVTPNLGTPSAATLTNATGLPIASGVSGLATGVATFLGTPSSANFAAALTDETGTGAAVMANGPTLIAPALGTPASGIATNLTGLPLSTGVTGTLGLANGGTAQTTAASARSSSGLNIDQARSIGDTNATLLATDRTAITSASLTAARTWTLPAASALNPGQELDVMDAAGGVGSTNTLTIARAGSDTVNGSTLAVISSQYGGLRFKSDGVSKWTYVPAATGGGSGTVTSVTCGTGLSGGTFTTSGTCAISAPVSVANGGTAGTTTAAARSNLGVNNGSSIANLGMSFSVGSSALTATVTQADGSTAPTSSNPVVISMRSATAGSGGFNERTITATQTLTVPSTATLGHVSGIASVLYWYEIDNVGTLELAVSYNYFGQAGIVSTTAIAGGSNTGTTMYSTTARAGVPFRLVGRTIDTQTAAGTWTATPTEVVAGSITQQAARFLATKNGTAQSGIASATDTKLTFTTQAWGDGGYYDATNSRWYPPPGRFTMRAAAQLSGGQVAGSFFSIFVLKNGSYFKGIFGDYNSVISQSRAIVVQDTSTGSDYYEIGVNAGGAGTKTIAGGADANWFAGEMEQGNG